MTNMMDNPSPAEVVHLREAVQSRLGLGITAAQDRCAEALHTSRRAWQQWETGDRKMHPAFWELANIKLKSNGKRITHELRNKAISTDRREVDVS